MSSTFVPLNGRVLPQPPGAVVLDPTVLSVDSNHSNILNVGRFVDVTPSYTLVSKDSIKIFKITGTGASFTILAAATGVNFKASVDGGAFFDVVSTVASANETLTLFSGLSNTAHIVVLIAQNGPGAYFLISAGITIVGFTYNAGVGLPGASDGYGPLAILGSNPAYLEKGVWVDNSYYGTPPAWGQPFLDARFRFNGQAETIKIFTFLDGGVLALDVDNVKYSTVTLPNLSTFGLVTLATGLDGLPHTFGVAGVSRSALAYADTVMLVGAGAAFGSSLASANLLGVLGDSISEGLGPTDTSEAITYQIALGLGLSPLNRGVGGYKIANVKAITAHVTDYNTGVAKVLIICGTNDLNDSTALVDYQADWTDTLNQLLSGLTLGQIIHVLKILPRTVVGYTPNQVKAYDDALVAAVAACSAPSRVSVHNVGGAAPWILQYNGDSSAYTDPNTDTTDGLHPNAAGCAKIVAQLLPLLA